MSHTISSLTRKLSDAALISGIDLIGVTSAEPFWVTGEKPREVIPKEIFPGARAIIVAGCSFYHQLNTVPSEPGTPRGRFTCGSRAYMPMRRFVQKVVQGILKKEGFQVLSSLKIPAKMAAVRSGVGKYGKNCVVLTEKHGSWVMFDSLITDAPLDFEDHDITSSPCGTCDICLQKCPTQAIMKNQKLNRADCITNWLWGKFVPAHLREKQGDHLFGCGECLRACPKNENIPVPAHFPFSLENYIDSVELIPLIKADSEQFKRLVPSFPRWAGMDVIKGNAIIALGNSGDPAATDALEQMLSHHKVQVRAYAAWALGKINTQKTMRILEDALKREHNKKVLAEIKVWL